MEKARKGEIAFLLLKHRMKSEGFKLSTQTPREIGNMAKAINIPPGEVLEFVELVTRETVDEIFAKKKDPKTEKDVHDDNP